MQAKTLNQIIAELEAWASSHLQVHSFGQGDIWEVSPSSSAFTFPLMWVTPSNAEPKQNELVEQFNVIVCDLVDNGEANELEVLSDTRQILKDLVAWYRQQHSAAYIVEFQGAITPFTERFAERVSGNALTIRLRQPDDYDECAIPLGNPIPAPPFCGPAIYELRDTLGNLLSTGSIASGDTEPIVAPDGTVLRDGQPFGSVPSGGSIDVPSAACADASVTINTVPSDTVASGGVLPLVVTLDGGATTPTYNSGTKTIDVTSVPCPPPSQEWVRPSNWIAIPDLTASDDRFYGLLAVFEHGPNVLTLRTAGGAASVDWGDGTSDVTGGVQVNKVYDYATIAQPVTVYHDGRNMKQVMVDVQKTSATLPELLFRLTSPVSPTGASSNFLDINLSLPTTTFLLLSLSQKPMAICERLRMWSTGVVSAINLSDMFALQSLQFPSLTQGSWVSVMSGGVYSFEIEDIDWASATINNAFTNSQITTHGNLTASSTNLAQYALGAARLRTFGNITAPNATALNSFFQSCRTLTSVGVINAPSAQNLFQMFFGCTVLSSVSFTDCAAVTNVTNIFIGCTNLVSAVMTNLTRGVSFVGTAVSNYGIGNFANSLGIAAGVQIITVTGTPYGALLAALDPTAVTIAAVMSGKGYTISN